MLGNATSIVFDPQTWQIAANVAAVIAASIVSITAVFAYWQICEMRRNNLIQGTIAVLDMTDEVDFRKDCMFVYRKFPSDPKALTRGQLDKAEKVWGTLGRIGMMLQEKMLPRHFTFVMFSDVAIRAWNKLRPRIELERKLRNDPLFMMHFEYLVDESRKYREKEFPGKELETFTIP